MPAFVPRPDQLPDLPVRDAMGALLQALAHHPRAILQAPPGSGKTTLVPLLLADQPWLAPDRRIVMLQPRRLAARAAAARLASLLGEAVGQRVGYRVRMDARVSRETRIEILTEGLLTRRLQSDPALEGVGLVIFDEIHERSLHADLALALALEAQEAMAPDLRILAMSATLDAGRLQPLFGDVPVVTAEGRMFPVAITYDQSDDRRSMPDRVASAVRAALEAPGGDLLVFLPGAGMINQVAGLLTGGPLPRGVSVHPLYAAISEQAQAEALAPAAPGTRKVVLATTIAETSLTLPGVTGVIDSGLTRRPRFDPTSGLTRLETVRVSRAAATQRAGRAGRVAAGTCHRLWLQAAHGALAAHDPPEILAADLAGFLLELAAWGVPDPSTMRFADPPPAAAIAQARGVLQALGALDDAGAITPRGRRMAELPVHPRLAAMVLRAAELEPSHPGAERLAVLLAALAEEGEVLSGEGQAPPVDLVARLRLAAGIDRQPPPGTRLDRRTLERVRQVARDLERRLGLRSREGLEADGIDDLAAVLTAFAWPERIAVLRPRERGRAEDGRPRTIRYQLVSGAGVSVPPQPPGWERPRLLAVALIQAPSSGTGQEGVVQWAAPLAPALLDRHFPQLRRETVTISFDPAKDQAVARAELRLGPALMDSRPVPLPDDPDAIAAALLAGLRRQQGKALPLGAKVAALQQRLATLRRLDPDGDWPDCSTAALFERLELWLGHHLHGLTSLGEVFRLDLAELLRQSLTWPQQQRLEAWLPDSLEVPSGNRIRLDYTDPDRPVLAVRIQEVFGWKETPRLAGGRLPVVLHLLSPGWKPAQVTEDLASFWARGYAQVRAELRGRYIRHYWPEDPLTAEPQRSTRQKRS